MSIYDELQPVATELLTEFNQGAMVYVKIAPGNGPKDNPGPATRIPFPLMGAANGVAQRYIDSGLAVAADLQIVAAVDKRYEPSMSDIITVSGKDHKIKQVIPKPATGTPVAYLYIVGRS